MTTSAVPGDHHTTTAPEVAVTSLTDHDLAILAARLTDPNVTALPWVNDAHEMYQAHPTGIENMGVWVAESCDPDTVDGGTANAALIVAAVNALPGLLAEVKRLRAELATARAAIEAVRQVSVRTDEHGDLVVLSRDILAALAAPAVCTCGAAPVHQHGCQAGQ